MEGVLSDGSSVAAEALWLLQMESCADRRTSCAWSSCPTCQYVTCTRHACASGSAVRCAVLGWRSAGGRLSGGAMLLGVTRMMHRSHVATGRRRGGASEQQVGRVVVDGDAVRAYPVYAVRVPPRETSLRIRIIAARHCPFPAFARFGFHVSRAVPGRAAVRSSRRGVVICATSNIQARSVGRSPDCR